MNTELINFGIGLVVIELHVARGIDDCLSAPARPARPIGKIPRLQHRLAQAAGDGWTLLPHAYCFLSPLFSTGIAWSLLAVERLAFLLERVPEGLQRYGDLLSLEADHIQKLVAGLSENGMAVIFISAELEEVLRLSHRIGILRDRRKVAEIVNSSSISQPELEVYAYALAGSRLLAGGSAPLRSLESGARSTLEIPLLGDPGSSPVQLQAPPTNLR